MVNVMVEIKIEKIYKGEWGEFTQFFSFYGTPALTGRECCS